MGNRFNAERDRTDGEGEIEGESRRTEYTAKSLSLKDGMVYSN